MALPKDKKSGITIGKVAAIGGLVAGLITSGGTIFTCADEWSAIRHAPETGASLKVEVDSLDAAIDVMRDQYGDHLEANKSAWKMHTGFPIKDSHPTLREGHND